ncbi:hypothetical protein IAU59_000204 [Kwoniella sp. CBS 9459]
MFPMIPTLLRSLHWAARVSRSNRPPQPRQTPTFVVNSLHLPSPRINARNVPREIEHSVYVEAELSTDVTVRLDDLAPFRKGALVLATMFDLKLLDHLKDHGRAQQSYRARAAIKSIAFGDALIDRASHSLIRDSILYDFDSGTKTASSVRGALCKEELDTNFRRLPPHFTHYVFLRSMRPLSKLLKPASSRVLISVFPEESTPDVQSGTRPPPSSVTRSPTASSLVRHNPMTFLDTNIVLQHEEDIQDLIQATGRLEKTMTVVPEVLAEIKSVGGKRKLQAYRSSGRVDVMESGSTTTRKGLTMQGARKETTGDEVIRAEAFEVAAKNSRPGLLLTRDISMGHILRVLRPEVDGQSVMEVILHPKSRWGMPKGPDEWIDVLRRAEAELQTAMEDREQERSKLRKSSW